MFRILYAVILIIAAFLAPPALAANLLAGVVGLSYLSTSVPSIAPDPTRTSGAHAREFVEVAGGMVMFDEVDGVVVTRFFRKHVG